MSNSGMETRDIFHNISPIDHRYSVSERPVFEALALWLSEEASIAACVKAEIALIAAHLAIREIEGGSLPPGPHPANGFAGVASHPPLRGTAENPERSASAGASSPATPPALSPELRVVLHRAGESVTPEEVYAEEEKTRHNIRALVNVLKKKTPAELAPLVHLGATSVDILDTALAYRMKGCCRNVILPALRRLETLLCGFTEREAETPQVGRTHGQHAVPVTLGFAMAEYVSRLGKSIMEIERLSANLKGKLAGAVGAYNATGMIVRDPEELERLYLAELGLEPSEHSTQLVEPEYLLRLLLEYNIAFGIIANLADDLRNLQRTEIGELREGFALDQVGSSTMPQKRNPWNSEHVKSLWKAFMPRVTTFFMDQISEHQRDLSNSASQRFIADYIAGFCLAVHRMASVVESLGADREKCLENLRSGGAGISGGVLAEPAYILLAKAGVSDAHELIRKVTLKAEKGNFSFSQAIAGESELLERIGKQLLALAPEETSAAETKAARDPAAVALEFFSRPEKYCGLAVKKAKKLAAKYRKAAGTIVEEEKNV